MGVAATAAQRQHRVVARGRRVSEEEGCKVIAKRMPKAPKIYSPLSRRPKAGLFHVTCQTPGTGGFCMFGSIESIDDAVR
jgi:hypothetical protein